MWVITYEHSLDSNCNSWECWEYPSSSISFDEPLSTASESSASLVRCSDAEGVEDAHLQFLKVLSSGSSDDELEEVGGVLDSVNLGFRAITGWGRFFVPVDDNLGDDSQPFSFGLLLPTVRGGSGDAQTLTLRWLLLRWLLLD